MYLGEVLVPGLGPIMNILSEDYIGWALWDHCYRGDIKMFVRPTDFKDELSR